MFGFSRKKGKKEEASRLEGQEPDSNQSTPPKAPLKVREGAGSLKPPEENSQEVPAGDMPGRAQSKPARPKLRLMTGQEERERAFLAAREQYVSKSLPEIKKEVSRKERSKTFDVLAEKLFAVIGLFIIACAGFWLYDNATVLDNLWQNFLDGLKFI